MKYLWSQKVLISSSFCAVRARGGDENANVLSLTWKLVKLVDGVLQANAADNFLERKLSLEKAAKALLMAY